MFVPVGENGSGDPVKVCRLRLRNDSSRKRRLTVTWFAEWTLGSTREAQQIHIQTSRDEESGALLARQYWSGASRGDWAFAASNPKASSWSCDRGQFLGRDGSRSNPAALDRVRLDNRAGTGADPCAAQQIAVTLERGQQTEVVLLLGQAKSVEDMRGIVKRLQSPESVETTLEATRGWWDSMLGSVQVKTPVLSVDLMLNRWLLYQALSCRFWGRSASYPIQRSLWISRSTAGFDRIRLCGPATTDPQAHSDSGGPAVFGGRCTALVASGNGRRRPNPLLGRFALAAVRGCALRKGHE